MSDNWKKSSHSVNENTCVEVWRTASRCGGGDCVEVAGMAGTVRVRDSKDRGGPELHFGGDAWRRFLRWLR